MARQIRSTVTEDGTVVLSIADAEVPEPGDDEVVIRVEAAPINPSDLGPMFGPAELRLAPAEQCLVLPDGVTAAEGASCFVNPLTTLGMIETMRLEGHTALVHTAAAASNLGQMLVKLCLEDDVPLVNVIRRQEQVDLLTDLGATHVCNSSDDDFMATLTDAVATTDVTIAFGATGGGTLASQILRAMETAQAEKEGAVGRYGSSRHKQVYVYGGLDRSPTVLDRTYGMAWGVGSWLLPYFLDRVGPERADELRQRVAAEITTTFAGSYTATVSLDEALTVDAASTYGRQATGEKYLINPSKSS